MRGVVYRLVGAIRNIPHPRTDTVLTEIDTSFAFFVVNPDSFAFTNPVRA